MRNFNMFHISANFD